ncbi:MAG: hypothetical protein KDA91_11700 [Planctomycetaceae bacterium]|nr:hypothetical protein [Planctomycetaceae bacterium]
MKPISCNLIRSTAAVCVLIVSGFAHAEDGVVRLSDRGSAGMIRQSDHVPAGFQQAAYAPDLTPVPEYGQYAGCVTPGPGCALPEMSCGMMGACGDSCGYQPCDPCGGCGDGCGEFCGSACSCDGGQCYYGPGYQQRMITLFPKKACPSTGSAVRDVWRGHAMSFRNKNARLADHLFGWMIPSGCCGKGCPPVGKYNITYADQPGYADSRDGQMYAAQGYGIPMTVPLAPNVHQQYNYSWGVPSSRLTQISNYNPATSAQPLHHQTWPSGAVAPAARHLHTPGETLRRAHEYLHPGNF